MEKILQLEQITEKDLANYNLTNHERPNSSEDDFTTQSKSNDIYISEIYDSPKDSVDKKSDSLIKNDDINMKKQFIEGLNVDEEFLFIQHSENLCEEKAKTKEKENQFTK